jgi:hypothetical protein
MRLALFILAASLPLAAQTFTLGTSADPCTGGTPYTIPSTGATLRYGDFLCTFPVSTDGMYQVRLDFQEPCISACSPPVTGPRQRAENVYLNDFPAVMGLDPYQAGSTSATAVISRTNTVFSAGLKIIVRVQTVLRAGILSAVSVTPASPTFTGQPCVVTDQYPFIMAQLADGSCLPLIVVIPAALAGSVPTNAGAWITIDGDNIIQPVGWHLAGRLAVRFR